MDSQPVGPVVDHCLCKRNVSTFDQTADSRQIRKTLVVLKRSQAGHGPSVLGDHDFSPLLYVVEKSGEVLARFAYTGPSHDEDYVTCST